MKRRLGGGGFSEGVKQGGQGFCQMKGGLLRERVRASVKGYESRA